MNAVINPATLTNPPPTCAASGCAEPATNSALLTLPEPTGTVEFRICPRHSPQGTAS